MNTRRFTQHLARRAALMLLLCVLFISGTRVWGADNFVPLFDGKVVGGLYETLGRAWVVQPKPEAIKTYYKDKDWNEMAISAIGGDVTVTVNGVQTAAIRPLKPTTSFCWMRLT